MLSLWSLNLEICKAFAHLFGILLADLFTFSLNKSPFLHYSLQLNPATLCIDTIFHPWDDLDVCILTPFGIVQQVMEKLCTAKNIKRILIAPL